MQKVTGGCHCGAVRFEAEADTANTMTCNCSHCQIKGMILTFTPQDNLRITKGEDSLKEYRFNKHVIAHQFCPTCGVEPFAKATAPDGREMAAINMRCVDGAEPDQMTPKMFDGRKL